MIEIMGAHKFYNPEYSVDFFSLKKVSFLKEKK